MNRSFALIASSVLGLSTLAVARDAHALGPIDLEVGAKVGGATNPLTGNGVPNPLGFGLGGRAGIAFLGGIYLGGNIMYYLGSSSTPPCPGAGANGGITTGVVCSTSSVTLSTLMYGGELGYGIKILDLLTIRPQVGVGSATMSFSNNGPSYSSWYLEPGVTAMVGLGIFFVGADANVLLLPSMNVPDTGNQAAFTIHGQVGLKF